MRDKKGRYLPGHTQPKEHPWKRAFMLLAKRPEKTCIVGPDGSYTWIQEGENADNNVLR